MNPFLRGLWASMMATSSIAMALFKTLRKHTPQHHALLTHNIPSAKNLSTEEQTRLTMFSNYGLSLIHI